VSRGCGKTTLANILSHNNTIKYPVYSADDFFMHGEEYRFDVKLLPLAHAYCKQKTRSAMVLKIEKIFVANTFTRKWEMQGYFDLAKEFKYNVFVMVVENYHENKNVHSVPDEHVQNMKDRFEIQL